MKRFIIALSILMVLVVIVSCRRSVENKSIPQPSVVAQRAMSDRSAERLLHHEIIYTPQEAQALKEFMTKYNPTVEGCRSIISAADNGLGSLACMLAGFISVTTIKQAPVLAEELKAVVRKNKIAFAHTPGTHFVLFTPSGKQQALLYLKNQLDGAETTRSTYLNSKLLDYSDNNILARYTSDGKPNPNERFEQDKQAAITWIANTTQTVEQWIRDNAAQHNLLFGWLGQ